MLIFDAHLDLAMNALEWNRDLTRPVAEIRRREQGLSDKVDRGHGTVALPEMRRGGVGLCVATMIARYVSPENPLPGWNSPAQASAQTQGQLAWYRAMEDAGEMVQIRRRRPAWRGTSLCGTNAAAGTAASSQFQTALGQPTADRLYPQSRRGRFDRHAPSFGAGPCPRACERSARPTMAPASMPKALMPPAVSARAAANCSPKCSGWGSFSTPRISPTNRFGKRSTPLPGRVWASHNNVRDLVPDTRQFSDEQIRRLVARGAVIGAVLDGWMMIPGWVRGQTTPDSAGLKLERIIDHIDHICQLAGNARHVGIGSDLDGAFGREQSPRRSRHDRRPGPSAAASWPPAAIPASGHFPNHARQLDSLLAGRLESDVGACAACHCLTTATRG